MIWCVAMLFLFFIFFDFGLVFFCLFAWEFISLFLCLLDWTDFVDRSFERFGFHASIFVVTQTQWHTKRRSRTKKFIPIAYVNHLLWNPLSLNINGMVFLLYFYFEKPLAFSAASFFYSCDFCHLFSNINWQFELLSYEFSLLNHFKSCCVFLGWSSQICFSFFSVTFTIRQPFAW